MNLIFSFLFLFTCFLGCNSLDEKIISGTLKKNKFSHKGPVTVQGSMEVTQLQAKSLVVQGYAKLGGSFESNIEEDALIQGYLIAKNLVVGGDLIVAGDANNRIIGSRVQGNLIVNGDTELTDTQIHGNIIIKKGNKITLNNNIQVYGFIRFEDQYGTVLINGQRINLLKGIVNGKHDKLSTETGTGSLSF